jgi:hypothetical protein
MTLTQKRSVQRTHREAFGKHQEVSGVAGVGYEFDWKVSLGLGTIAISAALIWISIWKMSFGAW